MNGECGSWGWGLVLPNAVSDDQSTPLRLGKPLATAGYLFARRGSHPGGILCPLAVLRFTSRWPTNHELAWFGGHKGVYDTDFEELQTTRGLLRGQGKSGPQSDATVQSPVLAAARKLYKFSQVSYGWIPRFRVKWFHSENASSA